MRSTAFNKIYLCLLVAGFLLTTRTGIAQSLSAEPDSIVIQKGQAAYEAGNYVESIDLMRGVLATDSLRADAHAVIALAYKARGKHLLASRHARLAVRHGKGDIKYLEIRHRVGFVNPVPVARIRKRALVRRMLEKDPGNAYAHTERGRDHALIYFYHKDRIRATGSMAPPNLLANNTRQVQEGEGLIGDVQAVGVSNIRDPFDLDHVENLGFMLVDASEHANEALPKARYHVLRALRTEPAYPEAVELLMGLYAFSEDHEPMLAQAKTAVLLDPENAYFNLYLGYAAYKMSEIELSRISYEKGISLLNEEDRAVFLDVKRVMNRKQIRAADSTDLVSEEFWKNQDPLFLTEHNERELEHYSRLVFSDLLFGEPKLNRRGWDSERGEIYIRYGPPRKMFYYTGNVENCSPSGVGNHSNFHIFDYGTYKFAFSSPGNSMGVGGSGASSIIIPTLNDYILYSPCAQMFAHRRVAASDLDYVIIAASHIKKMPTDFRLGGNAVEFPHLTTQLRDENNQPQVLVAYGFPVLMEEAKDKASGSTTRIGLNTGAFLVGEDGPVTQSTREYEDVYADEILLFDGAALWPGTHLLSVDPGEYTLSVEFTRETDKAVGSRQEEIEISALDGEFAMSDILLAYFIENNESSDQSTMPSGTLVRNGYEIQPAPWGLYENGRAVYLYFELYNLPRAPDGTALYTVEAAIVDRKKAEKRSRGLFRRARRNGEGVAVKFDSTVPSDKSSEYFILETDDIPVGNYTLIVQVTDKATGKKVERRRNLYLK